MTQRNATAKVADERVWLRRSEQGKTVRPVYVQQRVSGRGER